MKNGIKTFTMWLIVGIILLFVIPQVIELSNKKMTYSELIEKANNGEVTDIVIDYSGTGAVVKLKDDPNVKKVNIPNVQNLMDNLNDAMKQNKVSVTMDDEPFFAIVSDLLIPISSIILIFLMLLLFMGGPQRQGGTGAMPFGKSKAKVINSNSKTKVTFNDVAGIDEEKEELQEVVEFLKNPKKFTDMGARIPKGVLLVGQPGTGKTLLARAVAGEAGVPFFYISGSDFVEMFVGVGASRVRDLFDEAKRNAPSIIFIDEIDAVGRQRGAGLGGGHDEREQTLNQLLVEMDGFSANEGVIAFERCIEEATSIIGFLIAKQEPRLKILDAATAVSCMSKSVLEMISVCPKAVIRAKLLEEASQVLKVPQSDLEHDMCFVSGIPKCDGLVSGELTRREVSSGGYLRLLELSLRVLLSRPELKGNNDIWRILKEGYIDAYVGEETTRRTVNKWMMGAECVLDDNDKEEVEKLALHNEIELSPQSVLMELLRRIWLMHVKSGAHVACEDVERIARSSWSDFCKSIHS